MTVEVLQSEHSTGYDADHEPQFHHSLEPSLVLGMAATVVLILLAFFVYGQATPGA